MWCCDLDLVSLFLSFRLDRSGYKRAWSRLPVIVLQIFKCCHNHLRALYSRSQGASAELVMVCAVVLEISVRQAHSCNPRHLFPGQS